MSWYKTGSIAATDGSKIITGTGTQFTNPLNGVSAGRMLLLPGSGTVQIYEIESVQSDTELTLVSAFSGATGSGKLYAIPTSPSVSIEQFAHEFASTLAYYQQQLQGWQSILTGTGDVTLTTPDGQSVTVRSQSEWDRLLNTKIGAGEFGWGGKAINVGSGVNLFDYFTRERAAGLYWVNQTGINRPPNFADCVLLWNPIEHADFYGCLMAIGFTTGGAKTASVSVQNGVWENAWTTDWNSKNLNPMTTDTIQAINTLKVFIRNYASFMVQSGSVGAASWIEGQDNDGSTRWILGFPNDNDNTLTLRNYKGGVLALDAQRIIFPASKGFVRNAQALEYATGAEFGEYLKSEQSAGSAPVNSVWRAFLSVRHRGGNGNLEPGFDSTQWGWALVDNNMTQGNFNEFVLEKTINGTFLTSVRLWHTGNTTVDGNGYLRTASPIVKLFADGSSELNAESEGVVTERIGTGRYRISGCLGLNSDLAWGGVEGGIVGPRCRNGLERLWIDYDVESDGSIVIRTYHRTHPNAMLFARNELDGYAEGDPIDVPTDTFLSIRVQMPEREETPYEPIIKPA
ncbi:hypothetical protein ABRP58_18850 [Pectobacterium aroidearum]|uniref:phage tail fiber protein n=1 Tax=Pectobacterium aroidearum TaxID=1201031 RepID=UPI0032F0147C